MAAFKNNYVSNTVGTYNIFPFHLLLIPKTKISDRKKEGNN